jgi:3',5'-cyclic AMP phosphodiesterase CpdA
MNKNNILITALFFIMVRPLILGNGIYAQVSGENLPVKIPTTENYPEIAFYGVGNMVSINQIQSCIKADGEDGLLYDMIGVTSLLDGTTIDPSHIYGKIYLGPYPFESSEVHYTYHRFRLVSRIKKGQGELPVTYLLQPSINSEGWIDKGVVVVRLELYLETDKEDRHLGTYDTYIAFKKEGDKHVKLPTIIEGPFVNLLTSDEPTRMVVSFRTDTNIKTQVVVADNIFAEKMPGTYHEITVTGLVPDKQYHYYVQIGEMKSKTYTFRSAPLKGEGEVCFAYAGDSREGSGGGAYNFMGVNRATLERLMNLAFLQGADFFLFGGDLINGYTTVKEDFVDQLYSWKQGIGGFFHERPVYAAMGNHEALLRVFDDASRYGISLDRWPYETESAEAVYVEEFVHPHNGPKASDKQRPTYEENVYSFQYGPVKVICFNNNYWVSYQADKFGGCPEGYIMADQLTWIKKELQKAEHDKTVRYVILFAQEPVFPNSVHADDAMWYEGDNNVRAYTYNSKTQKLQAAKKGMVEVRNEFARAVSQCKKVAAVLGADEHSYSRVIIDRNVPVGVPKRDDKNNNGKIGDKGEKYSPISDLRHATWYFSAGDAGAPYYAEVELPWNSYWKNQPDKEKYYFTSQEHVLIFNADKEKISLTVYNPYGEIIDKIDNLIAIK